MGKKNRYNSTPKESTPKPEKIKKNNFEGLFQVHHAQPHQDIETHDFKIPLRRLVPAGAQNKVVVNHVVTGAMHPENLLKPNASPYFPPEEALAFDMS